MNNSFYKRFWLESTLEQAKQKFVNRVNIRIFDELENNNSYDAIFRRACINLWEDSEKFITQESLFNPYTNKYKNLKYLTNNDFEKTKHVLEFTCFNPDDIIYCLNKTMEVDWIDLWINFINWKFIQKWDILLDENILNKSFDSLIWFKVKKIWEEALEEYLKWDFDDALWKCFTTLDELFYEKFWKKFSVIFKSNTISEQLNFNKELSKYWDWLESNTWGGKIIERWIIQNLYQYLNEYSTRHANWWKYNINENEVEAVLYLTWLIINLVAKK